MSHAQGYIFDFTTSLGNGSFTLDLNSLTAYDSTNNSTAYFDPFDVLTFNGTNYDHLILSVYNNLKLVGSSDGFIIQAGSGGTTNTPDVFIAAFGNPFIISGSSNSDLFKVLSSFGRFYSGGGVYPSPFISLQDDPINPRVQGDLLSFQLVSTPEPATASLLSLGTISLLFWRHRFFLKLY